MVSIWSIFIQIFLVGCEKLFHFCKNYVSVVQGHPRSLIVAPIESTYVTSYYIVCNSNLAPFRRYGSFYVLLTPPLSTVIFGVFLLHQITHVGVSMLFVSEIVIELFQPMWSRYLNVTDGQTTYNLITMLCIALRSKTVIKQHCISMPRWKQVCNPLQFQCFDALT